MCSRFDPRMLLALCLALPLAACRAEAHPPQPTGGPAATGAFYHPLSDAELEAQKKRLTPEQFRVTQEEGTEPPFKNEYWDNHAPGIYVDVVSGEPLFSSREKFNSGTGWPSFWAPLEKDNIGTRADHSLFMDRNEVRSKRAQSHLGHVFDDGPAPTGLRYCMNSAALRFIPAERLTLEGYAPYGKLFPDIKQLPAPEQKPPPTGATGAPAASPTGNPAAAPGDTPAGAPRSAVDFPSDAVKAAAENRKGVAPELEVAVLAGGCFWGMQSLLRKLDGVVKTEVGYAGGSEKDAEYEIVSGGSTGHAESVKVIFDPKRVSYDKVLTYFFRIHDPTTLNRQENDRGTQYRSAIYAQSASQLSAARDVKLRLERSGKVDGPVVTQISPTVQFYPAESYHQDYLEKHPNGYMCHFVRKFEF